MDQKEPRYPHKKTRVHGTNYTINQ